MQLQLYPNSHPFDITCSRMTVKYVHVINTISVSSSGGKLPPPPPPPKEREKTKKRKGEREKDRERRWGRGVAMLAVFCTTVQLISNPL